MIRVHAHAALMHKLGGAHENILDNFVHIHGRSVIDTIPLGPGPGPLRNSPTILVSELSPASVQAIARQPVEFLRLNGSSYGGRTCFILTGTLGQPIAIRT